MNIKRVLMVCACVVYAHSAQGMWAAMASLGQRLGVLANGSVAAECEQVVEACCTQDDAMKKQALEALGSALAAGKNVHGGDRDGRCGLYNLGDHLGCRAGGIPPCDEMVEAVKLMIRAGADAKKIRFAVADRNLLHRAAVNGYYELVVPFVRAGIDVNEGDEDGETPLLIAASNAGWCARQKRGNIDYFMRILIDLKADVNKKSRTGSTPLHWASTQSAVDLLVLSHADIEATNNESETPLLNAVSSGNVEQVIALLGWKACVDAQNKAGHTPLVVAQQMPVSYFYSQETKEHMVQLLLKASNVSNDAQGENQDDQKEG